MKRLSDKLIAAHEQACAQGKAEVARHLLQALEIELSAIGGREETRDVDAAVTAAFQRQQALTSPS
ncbi:hypothetical protein CKO28_22510 [Rhodovibrio sodomensis]|uniref:CopG family transcriptional regulator n=1 Tax=Rhodovibrio sodomensis TaxID=1088 RepID=A0ABS1DM35_9PROT|nr:hypothetical protein [Rhodovibrio sodomensis]MBK1670793.1 hypothetical protein [Rhodovibrio sodomensis]